MQRRPRLTNIILLALHLLAVRKSDTIAATMHVATPTATPPAVAFQDDIPMRQLPTQAATDDRSCATPAPAFQQICDALAREILASVVRIEVRAPAINAGGRWAGGQGHGTIMDARYVVIHNHFGVPLSMLKDVESNGAAAVSIYKANGEKLLLEAPPTVFTVVVEDSETLVLDFGANDADQGFFEILGMPSAQFKAWEDVQLMIGVEVAQVDWNGTVAHIDWVRINDFGLEDSTPILELDNALTLGASGGGVFWRGYHIANNWSTVEVLDGTGTVVRQYSKAALNSPQVVAPLAGPAVAQATLEETAPVAVQG